MFYDVGVLILAIIALAVWGTYIYRRFRSGGGAADIRKAPRDEFPHHRRHA